MFAQRGREAHCLVASIVRMKHEWDGFRFPPRRRSCGGSIHGHDYFIVSDIIYKVLQKVNENIASSFESHFANAFGEVSNVWVRTVGVAHQVLAFHSSRTVNS